MTTAQIEKSVNYPSNYKPLEITTKVTIENTYPTINLYNENGELFNWSIVWNRNENAEVELLNHYATKFQVMDIMKAVNNKYKITGRIDSYDIDHLESITTNWIAKETIKQDFKYIRKELANGNVMYAYNLVMNMKQYFDYSVPATNENGFYLHSTY